MTLHPLVKRGWFRFLSFSHEEDSFGKEELPYSKLIPIV